MCLSFKNTKNIQIQYQISSKRIQWNTCIMGFKTKDKQLKFWSNLKLVSVKFQIISNLNFD